MKRRLAGVLVVLTLGCDHEARRAEARARHASETAQLKLLAEEDRRQRADFVARRCTTDLRLAWCEERRCRSATEGIDREVCISDCVGRCADGGREPC